MLRRNFLRSLAFGGGVAASGSVIDIENQHIKTKNPIDFSINGNIVSMYIPGVTKFTRILQISDTHLWMDDERGKDFMQYSGRMAKAYNKTKHFISGIETNPNECFENTLKIAADKKVDLIVLTGDIFSFPSEAAIEWAVKKLQETNIPYIYTSGNHDWHYEGMEGTLDQLRNTWLAKRLKPLYREGKPLYHAYPINGLKIITIDNSTYEVNEEQRRFFRQQLKSGNPILLLQHIPMYAKGRGVGFGCGHPEWSAKNDKSYKLERRESWPELGHNKDTLGYYEDVFSAHAVKGIFAGHTHQQSMDLVRGIPQFVTDANARGAYLQIDIFPESE